MTRKYFYLSLILLLAICGCRGSGADPYYSQIKRKKLPLLTIVDFLDEVKPERGKKLVTDLKRELAARDNIPLIEPARLETALRETKTPSPAYLDTMTARDLGKELKSDIILTGKIKDFHLEEKVTNVPLLWTATSYTATYKTEICLVRTFRKKQSIKEVIGRAEIKKRQLQLFYLGADKNFQFISALEKQRVVEAAYEDLLNKLVRAVTS